MAQRIHRQSSELDLDIDKGATFSLVVTWRSGELRDGCNPDTIPPVDVTGASAKGVFRPKEATDSTQDYVFSTALGTIMLNGASGEIEIKIPSGDTSAFTWDKAVYNVEITDVNGDVTRLLHGRVTTFDELVV